MNPLLWPDRRITAAAALGAAASWGLLAGWWTPRGPITTSEALFAIGISLLVGTFAGLAMRSRWAMLLAPATFAVLFELARMSTSGVLVDGIHLGSLYGVLAFALGRGLHGVLALVPMVLGAAFAAGIARHLGPAAAAPHGWGRIAIWGRRSTAAIVATAMVLLTASIIRPAHTDPIMGADGKKLPGSVAELATVNVGGHGLGMMIRGNSVNNPVLLYLAGGPGGTDMVAMRRHGQALEQSFTVATLDQRGSGKSYDALDPTKTLTPANGVRDTIQVTNYLRERFHQNKIYLAGNSWGSLIGVLAAQQNPELYSAYIGAGQMVDPVATDRIYYRDTLAWAQRTSNAQLVRQLTANGPPPYSNPLNYGTLLGNEQKVYPYDDSQLAESAFGFSDNLTGDEYTLMEELHNLAAFLDTFTVLYPQAQHIDLRTQVPRLQIPIYLVQGSHETPGRAEPAAEWFALLQAPTKQLIPFEAAGHRSLFQQPDLFYQVMTGTVLPQTRPSS